MIFATIAIALQTHFRELKQFDQLQSVEKPLVALSWLKPESPDKSLISSRKMNNNKCRPDYSTSALIQEFTNFRQHTCTIAAAGGEYLAILRSPHLNLKKSFQDRTEAEEYLWRNAAIAFFCCYVNYPAVIVKLDSLQIVTASDAACNLWNDNLFGVEFSRLSIDREDGDRLWQGIAQNGYVCCDIKAAKFDGQNINAKLAGETVKSPLGSYAFFKLSPAEL